MSPRILIAFLAGLVVASGITFFAMRKPQTAPQPVPVQQVRATPVTQAAPAPAPIAAPATAPVSDAMASTIPPKEHSAPRHTAPVRRERSPRLIAQARLPQPVPPPVQLPVQQTVQQPATQQQLPAETPPVATPSPAPEPPAQVATEPPPPPKPNSVTIPAGTTLAVRMGETVSTERNADGDSFVATLDQPLVVDGFVIAERGARAQGRVVQLMRSGKVQGLAKLGVELTQVTTSDGQRVKINTAAYERSADQTRRQDAEKVGGGAALGAIIGAIAGGGKGAAIGAGVGGAAGAGGVAMTRGKPVEIAVESRLSFRLKEPVTITEQLH